MQNEPSALKKFAPDVFEYLTTIPKGKVTTYGQIARDLFLSTPRLVGKILHQNPDSSQFPCHRVVFSDGRLAPGYAFGGAKVQEQKLRAEGVIFKKNKVDLSKCLF
ncbi:MAG: MGMT family protein [Pseudomonadales bacterium]|nr:MGMT family protein [Candidatus Woesebacteria bacterium]MCB9800657.1 MGMT family protein [Pseudomonadales bacterium]